MNELNDDHPDSVFQRGDRLEYWPKLKRMFRIGSLSELNVSDVERVRQAIRAFDSEAALSYLSYLHTLYLDMLRSYVEWAYSWSAFVADYRSVERAARVAQDAYIAWCQITDPNSESVGDESMESMMKLLHLGRCEAFSAGEFKDLLSSRHSNLLSAASHVPIRTYNAIVRSLANKEFAESATGVDLYVTIMCVRHDLFVKYIWACVTGVDRVFGQELAEVGLEAALSGCDYYDPFWKQVAQLNPDEIAAVAAEELRLHFSGFGRAGKVEILDEPDCYRLVFNPCGSGGVLRRQAVANGSENHGIFAKPSPATWGRAGEVPAYCAHCAQNELTSIRHIGYPVWVTEFDPDPNKPCGWTVFKKPEFIPDRYFARLGINDKNLGLPVAQHRIVDSSVVT